MRKVLTAIGVSILLVLASCEKDDPIPSPVIDNPETPSNPTTPTEPETPTTKHKYPDITVSGLDYPAPINEDLQRIAYFPSYRNVGEAYVPDYIYKSVDVACYAFASINASYGVDLKSPTVLEALVARAHKMGVKVVLSFNGTSATFVTMSQDASARSTFIKAVMAIVDKYNLDGVDNDWEYPSTKNGGDKGNLELMKEFSNILHDPGCDKLLTMAITPGKYSGSYRDAVLDDLFWCCDWFNVMTYDDYSTSAAGQNHASMTLVETAYNYYVTQRKMPSYKFSVGLPCYGRPSGITQSGTTMSYSTILTSGGSPDEDSATVSKSTYDNGNPYIIYYNGRPTIRKKVQFAKEKKLGGYFFWEQGQDCYTDESKSLIATAAATAAE